MTRFMKYLLTIGFLSILLVACGTNTDTTNSVKDTTNENEIKQTVEETEQEQEQENENNPVEEPKEQVEKESVEETSPATEIKISYSYNGESKQENAIWTKSDNQTFGIYILPTYELSAEEPNKDVLYYKEDDHHFMRIEVLPGDSDQNSLKETTLTQLQAVNEDVQTLSPEANDIQNATIMQAKKDNEIVTAYLIEQEDKFIKLTIFTNEQENHQDAFVQMAKNLKVD
ncbi:MAG: hypothetical protein WAM95_12840 [Bacillus sp. (in: firmicutes)]